MAIAIMACQPAGDTTQPRHPKRTRNGRLVSRGPLARPAPSYRAPFAGHALASRVDVAPRRRYETLQRVSLADVDALPAPHFVFVDDGLRIVVDHGSFVAVHEGGAVFSRGGGGSRAWSSLRADELVHGGDIIGFDGREREGPITSGALAGLVDEPGLQIATLVDDQRWLTLVQSSPPRDETVLWIASVPHASKGPTFDWRAKQFGHATGAIADDGRVLAATRDGGLTLYAGEGTGMGHAPHVLATRELGREFYAVSVMSDGFAVLESHVPGESVEYRAWRIYESPTASAATGWQTELHLLDDDATTRWTVEVPLAVTQPAIDGGKRIWLAGDGLAAVDDGRLVWSRTSKQRHHATAFKDGTVAVTYGDTLELVGPRGNSIQVLRVANGRLITTPPAISRDGRLWVATEDGRVWVTQENQDECIAN